MQRRSFLIQASGIMAGLWAKSTIAQPTIAAEKAFVAQSLPSQPQLKKRAILLGISQNAEAASTIEISNDLLLQQQLLQLRYGFSEQEIVRLTESEVTIAQVMTAIDAHFVGADVGIFHFSGLLSGTDGLELSDGVLSLTTLAEQLKQSKISHLTTVLDIKSNALIPDEILSVFPGLLVQPQPNSQNSLTQNWTQALWNSEKITVNTSGASSWKLTGNRKNEPAYFITALQTLGAGAIQQSKNDQTVVWLGGLNPNALALVGTGSILQVQHDRRLELLQVIERHERSATTRASASVAVGDPILESVRRIPRNLGLTVMMGEALSKIETVDAISAFSEVKTLEIIKPEMQTVSRPKHIDYIFTKLNPKTQSNRYALVNMHARDPIDGTLGDSGEAIKNAVRRLRPQLRSLQARKLLRATIHDEATSIKTLDIKATLNRINEKNGSVQNIPHQPKQSPIQSGDRLRYQIQNLGQASIYWLLWQWDNALNGSIVLPPLESSLGIISGGAHQPIMSGLTRSDWTVRNVGKIESFLICSLTPFTATYAQLVSIKEDQFVRSVSDPLAVVEALLTDLQGTAATVDDYALNLAQSVTLPFHYEVAPLSS